MKSRRKLPARLRHLAEQRAGGICEYCRIRTEYDALPPVIDHIIAKKHGGTDEPENLAFCCAYCNAHKGANIAGIDPRTGRTVRIFNPRLDKWASHFRLSGATMIGLTPIGLATIAVLMINDPFRWEVRKALLMEGS
jgi:hypothetical protein